MTNNDCTTWDLSKLTVEYRLREQLVKSFAERPPLDDDQKKKHEKAKKEEVLLRNELFKRALNNQVTTPSQPQESAADFYIESQILSSHLAKLGKFTGANHDATAPWLAKVKSITQACPSFTWQRIYGAIKAYISQNVIKTLETVDIKDFKTFEATLKDNYGLLSNVYQQLEEWLTKSKPMAQSFAQHQSETAQALEPIIDSFEKDFIKMKEEAGSNSYKPGFRDGFTALRILKVLQAIRQDCDMTYSQIICELKGFKTAEQIAQRATSLSVQTAYKTVNTSDGGNAAGNNKKPRNRNKNKAAESGDDRKYQPINGNQNRGGQRGRPATGGYSDRGPHGQNNSRPNHGAGHSIEGQNSRSNGGHRGGYRGGRRGGHWKPSGRPSSGRGGSSGHANATFTDYEYQPFGYYNHEQDSAPQDEYYPQNETYCGDEGYDYSQNVSYSAAAGDSKN
jgi:hypothetical protein